MNSLQFFKSVILTLYDQHHQDDINNSLQKAKVNQKFAVSTYE